MNLLQETMDYINSKPYYYDDREQDFDSFCDSLNESTLTSMDIALKHTGGNHFKVGNHQFQTELKPQLTSKITPFNAAAEKAATTDEEKKRILSRRTAFNASRKKYGLDKAFERTVIACGSMINKKNEIYIWLTESTIKLLVLNMTMKQIQVNHLSGNVEPLHNYSKTGVISVYKDYAGRGGSRANSGRKAKQVDGV